MGEQLAAQSLCPDWAPLELYERYTCTEVVTFPDSVTITGDAFKAEVKLQGNESVDEPTIEWVCTVASAHVLHVEISAVGLDVGSIYVADLRWTPTGGVPVPVFRWDPITIARRVTDG